MFDLKTFLAGSATMGAVVTIFLTATGAKKAPHHAHFDEITVGRINIQEPDGSKRLVIANRSQFPGAFTQGKEIERPDRRDMAGMIFLDEEGNENGGFIQKGSMNAKGNVDAGLSLTFDRYRQDQALQFLHVNNENNAMTGIQINDVPFFKVTSLEDMMKFSEESAKLPPAEQKAYWNKLQEEGRLSQNRILLATSKDKSASLSLKDAKGRTRLSLSVNADGQAEIKMLDEQGKTVKTISAVN